MEPPLFDIVIPTIGREGLGILLGALSRQREQIPGRVIVVDDRADAAGPLPLSAATPALAAITEIVRGRARGPAAARNDGWKTATAEWVAFLDDDVVPSSDWAAALRTDVGGLPPDAGGSQGRIRVPLPSHRRPTDWERNVAGLEGAAWATADMAYRRAVLRAVGGFDERFTRAYREDADLALRTMDCGYRLVRGTRWIEHPVRPAPHWTSVKLQAGNADDALMTAIHGRGWRARASVPTGRRTAHLAIAGSALAAVAAAFSGRRRAALAALAVWAAGTVELAWNRIAPGPRSHQEVLRMASTSAAIPSAASWHWIKGLVVARRARPRRAPRPVSERQAA